MSERNYINAEKELEEFRKQNNININNLTSSNTNTSENKVARQNKINKIKNLDLSLSPPVDIIDRPYYN